MSGSTYSRRTDLVWRTGPDRILVHRIGSPPETAATELSGDVALVWLALDEPASTGELADRLADADLTVRDLHDDLVQLADAGLVTRTDTP